MIRFSPGILVAFEGIDGCGKTTQIEILETALRRAGVDVTRTREPTDGPHGRALRTSAQTGRLAPEEEAALFLADRRDHVRALIAPALARGAVVLVDRYYFSSIAYQGARGLNLAAIRRANEAIAPRPDLVIMIETSPATSIGRIHTRGTDPDRFEEDDNLRRVAAIFKTLPDPFIVRLPGDRSIPELSRMVMRAFCDGPLFARLCPHAEQGEAPNPPCRTKARGECPTPCLWTKLSSLADC